MKTVKIKFSAFTSLGNESFANSAATVLECLQEESVLFPTLPYATTVLENSIQDFVALNGAADGPQGSPNVRNERDLLRITIYEMLVADGIYVLGIANAKETYEAKKAMVESAGYIVANDTHNPVEVVPITGLQVIAPATPGVRTVDVRYKKGKAIACLLQGTQGNPNSDSAVWTNLKYCTTAKTQLTLEPGTWAVRAIGIYSAGEANASGYVSFIVG